MKNKMIKKNNIETKYIILALLTASICFSFFFIKQNIKNKVTILGRNAYYKEEISPVGFIIRKYYSHSSGELLAESFGYEINDYSVDIDGDGKDELICTCVWGGDGHTEAIIYDDTDEGVMKGTFSPNCVGLSKDAETNAFQCFFDTSTSAIYAKYWIDGRECTEQLTFSNADFKTINHDI